MEKKESEDANNRPNNPLPDSTSAAGTALQPMVTRILQKPLHAPSSETQALLNLDIQRQLLAPESVAPALGTYNIPVPGHPPQIMRPTRPKTRRPPFAATSWDLMNPQVNLERPPRPPTRRPSEQYPTVSVPSMQQQAINPGWVAQGNPNFLVQSAGDLKQQMFKHPIAQQQMMRRILPNSGEKLSPKDQITWNEMPTNMQSPEWVLEEKRRRYAALGVLESMIQILGMPPLAPSTLNDMSSSDIIQIIQRTEEQLRHVCVNPMASGMTSHMNSQNGTSLAPREQYNHSLLRDALSPHNNPQIQTNPPLLTENSNLVFPPFSKSATALLHEAAKNAKLRAAQLHHDLERQHIGNNSMTSPTMPLRYSDLNKHSLMHGRLPQLSNGGDHSPGIFHQSSQTVNSPMKISGAMGILPQETQRNQSLQQFQENKLPASHQQSAGYIQKFPSLYHSYLFQGRSPQASYDHQGTPQNNRQDEPLDLRVKRPEESSGFQPNGTNTQRVPTRKPGAFDLSFGNHLGLGATHLTTNNRNAAEVSMMPNPHTSVPRNVEEK